MKNRIKSLIIMLVFTAIIIVTTDVNATVVSYGYVDCDFDCSILGTVYDYSNNQKTYGQNICHDRWKPENNSCKGGTRHDNNGALIIDYNGSSVNMASTTDLFGIGSSEFKEGEKVNHFKIEKGTKNVFSVKKSGTVYVHDFRPLIEYYENFGKFPDNVVADYTGVNYKVFTSYLRYTYYPSDLRTSEDDFVTTARIKIEDWKYVDFIGDWDDYKVNKKKMCRNKEYLADHLDNGAPGQPADTCKLDEASHSAEINSSATIHYYFSKDLSENTDLNACEDLSAMVNKAKEAYKEGGHDSAEYTSAYKWILEMCGMESGVDGYIDKRTYSANSECYNICISFSDDFAEMDPEFMKYTNHCGFGEEMIAWIMRILKILRYIVPIIVIVTSTIEYISAIGAADDDAMKKTGNRFSKRLLIMIVFFILPSILQFLFNIFNVPGLDSSDPYCMKL